ncbi:MAG: DUF4426 domain-containing protein [Gammaproteobacteria bacterium]|nr:DUF4426 domain-containing protein [Gammaproteobacteria bacterium]
MRTIRMLTATLATAALIASCAQENGGQAGNDNIQAEPEGVTSKSFGDYVLHFNAISTDQLSPEVARAYNIVRSKNRAMLNVSIIKNTNGASGASESGTVNATAANLTGQIKNLTLREIREDKSIYYIGDVAVANSETLVFNIDVVPENGAETLSVRFSRQFFAD